METITLTVDESVLETARRVAAEQQTALEVVLVEWLTRGARNSYEYREMMASLKHVDSGGAFSRDEMNERR